MKKMIRGIGLFVVSILAVSQASAQRVVVEGVVAPIVPGIQANPLGLKVAPGLDTMGSLGLTPSASLIQFATPAPQISASLVAHQGAAVPPASKPVDWGESPSSIAQRKGLSAIMTPVTKKLAKKLGLSLFQFTPDPSQRNMTSLSSDKETGLKLRAGAVGVAFGSDGDSVGEAGIIKLHNSKDQELSITIHHSWNRWGRESSYMRVVVSQDGKEYKNWKEYPYHKDYSSNPNIGVVRQEIARFLGEDILGDVLEDAPAIPVPLEAMPSRLDPQLGERVSQEIAQAAAMPPVTMGEAFDGKKNPGAGTGISGSDVGVTDAVGQAFTSRSKIVYDDSWGTWPNLAAVVLAKGVSREQFEGVLKEAGLEGFHESKPEGGRYYRFVRNKPGKKYIVIITMPDAEQPATLLKLAMSDMVDKIRVSEMVFDLIKRTVARALKP